MDDELRIFLREMEERLDAQSEKRGREMEERLNQRGRDMEERLDTRIDSKLDEVFTRQSQFFLHEMEVRFGEVNVRLDSIDARLKLQSGLIQSGARALARFAEFAENSEERWVDLATRLQRLERRLDVK